MGVMIASAAWGQVLPVEVSARADRVIRTIGVPVGDTADEDWRMCRNDAFAVHVAAGLPDNFRTELRSKGDALIASARAASVGSDDFAAQDRTFWNAANSCKPGTRQWTVHPVVPPTDYLVTLECVQEPARVERRIGPKGRAIKVQPRDRRGDGLRRRPPKPIGGKLQPPPSLIGSGGSTGKVVIGLPKHRLCPWLSDLQTISGGKVARECDASPTGEGWADRQLGLPDSPELTGARVQVALIDTCTEANPNCRHARDVMAIVRRVARDVDFEPFAGLATPYGGPIADVAIALMKVAKAKPAIPIVNLSLGWPPEFNTESDVYGPSATAAVGRGPLVCKTQEAPAGLSVRSAISRIDDQTLVFAAAGNRPPWLGHEAFAKQPYLPAGFDSEKIVAIDQFSPTDIGRTPRRIVLAPVELLVKTTSSFAGPPFEFGALLPAESLASILSGYLDEDVFRQRHDKIDFVAPGTDVQLAEVTGTGSSYATAYGSGIAALVLQAMRAKAPGTTITADDLRKGIVQLASVPYGDPANPAAADGRRRLVHPEAADKSRLVRPVLPAKAGPSAPGSYAQEAASVQRRALLAHGTVGPTPLPSCPDPDDCAVFVHDDEYKADIDVQLDSAGGKNPIITITWPNDTYEMFTLDPDPLAGTNTVIQVHLDGLSMFSSKGDYELDFDVVDSTGKYLGRQNINLKKFWHDP